MLKNCVITLHSETSPNSHDFYCMGPAIPTYHTASNSVILSAAAYILHKHPNLTHPRNP